MWHSHHLRISLKVEKMFYARLSSTPFNELSEQETEILIVGLDVM